MDLLGIIRRWALRNHLPIREISRRTKLSRNTIRKYFRGDIVESKFRTPAHPGKLAAFSDQLLGMLKVETGKPRKQKRTLKQLHIDLVAFGFTVSYGLVAVFASRWKAEQRREQHASGLGTFVPLAFELGEAFQFDWSEDWALLATNE